MSEFWWDDDEDEEMFDEDLMPDLCAGCGIVAPIEDVCQECGLPLCYACFEGGGGFCKEHPSEGYKAEGEAVCGTCGRNEGVHECEVCGLWVCTECLEDAGAQRRVCPGCAEMLREDDEDPFYGDVTMKNARKVTVSEGIMELQIQVRMLFWAVLVICFDLLLLWGCLVWLMSKMNEAGIL